MKIKRTLNEYILQTTITTIILCKIANVETIDQLGKALKDLDPMIKDEYLERVNDFLDTTEEKIKHVFNRRSDYSQDRWALLQWVLDQEGLKLKRGKRSSHGKRKYYYFFEGENLNKYLNKGQTQ